MTAQGRLRLNQKDYATPQLSRTYCMSKFQGHVYLGSVLIESYKARVGVSAIGCAWHNCHGTGREVWAHLVSHNQVQRALRNAAICAPITDARAALAIPTLFFSPTRSQV